MKYRLFVKSIEATCDVREAEITRRMRCIDFDSIDKYSTEVNLSLPAIPGVGTGDLLEIKIDHVATAAEVEALRAAKLSE